MSQQLEAAPPVRFDTDPSGSIFLVKRQQDSETIPLTAYPVRLFVQELLRLGDDGVQAVEFLTPHSDEDEVAVQALYREARGHLLLRPQKSADPYRVNCIPTATINYERLKRAHERLDQMQQLPRSNSSRIGETALANTA